VENGAAFSTAGFVAKVTLTPTLSQGERGLAEQAFIYLNLGTLAISRRISSVGAAQGRDKTSASRAPETKKPGLGRVFS